MFRYQFLEFRIYIENFQGSLVSFMKTFLIYIFGFLSRNLNFSHKLRLENKQGQKTVPFIIKTQV